MLVNTSEIIVSRPTAKESLKYVSSIRTRVFIINEKGEFLILVRSLKDKGLPGYLIGLLPGGGVDEGESYIESLNREVKEEIGVTLESLQWLGETSFRRSPLNKWELAYFPEADVIETTLVFYVSYVKNFIIELKEPEKFAGYYWTSKENLEESCKIFNSNLGDGVLEFSKALKEV